MFAIPPRRRRRSFAIFAAALALTLPLLAIPGPKMALADGLPAPTGEVLLVVKGNIGRTNVGKEAHFDRSMLQELGFRRIVTRTPWHETETAFEGVPAMTLMEAVDGRGDALLATAANDYHVAIPVSDLAVQNVLLALRIDGVDLTLRTKGPVWVIYPDTSDMAPAVRAERMIWQLVGLEVR